MPGVRLPLERADMTKLIRKPAWRELLDGLAQTARRAWSSVVFLAAADTYAFVYHGLWAGLGWLLTTWSFLFAMWFHRQAIDGWNRVIEMTDADIERRREELKL